MLVFFQKTKEMIDRLINYKATQYYCRALTALVADGCHQNDMITEKGCGPVWMQISSSVSQNRRMRDKLIGIASSVQFTGRPPSLISAPNELSEQSQR